MEKWKRAKELCELIAANEAYLRTAEKAIVDEAIKNHVDGWSKVYGIRTALQSMRDELRAIQYRF